jgi:large subunit ribosomal protein L20
MVRVKRGFVARHRRKKVLLRAKGFRGALRKIFRPAKQAVVKAMKYSTVHRRLRKRQMRALWITRIGAAARQNGTSYSKLMSGIKKAKVLLDRKNLAEIAASDPKTFAKIADIAKSAGKKA